MPVKRCICLTCSKTGANKKISTFHKYFYERNYREKRVFVAPKNYFPCFVFCIVLSIACSAFCFALCSALCFVLYVALCSVLCFVSYVALCSDLHCILNCFPNCVLHCVISCVLHYVLHCVLHYSLHCLLNFFLHCFLHCVSIVFCIVCFHLVLQRG